MFQNIISMFSSAFAMNLHFVARISSAKKVFCPGRCPFNWQDTPFVGRIPASKAGYA